MTAVRCSLPTASWQSRRKSLGTCCHSLSRSSRLRASSATAIRRPRSGSIRRVWGASLRRDDRAQGRAPINRRTKVADVYTMRCRSIGAVIIASMLVGVDFVAGIAPPSQRPEVADKQTAPSALWAHKGRVNKVAIPGQTNRFQFGLMAIYLQHCQEKCEHDCRVEERGRSPRGRTVILRRNESAKRTP